MLKYLIRSCVIQTLMRFDGIVEVNKTLEFDLSLCAVSKDKFIVPHFHNGSDDPLCFAIGLRSGNASKLLTDAVLHAGIDESMVRSAFVFFTVVRVGVINLIWTLSDDIVYQECRSTVLGLIGHDVGVQFAREVVDGDKQVFTRLCALLSLEQRQAFGVEVHQLARVGFVVPFGCFLEAFLNRCFNFSQTF